MANIYQGPRSCYARHEGMYAPGRGINLVSAPAILWMLLRDLRRGYTYNHSCKKIRMTERLFERRARYLIPLCRKHNRGTARDTICSRVERLVEYVLRFRRLPRGVKLQIARVRPPRRAEALAVPLLARARAVAPRKKARRMARALLG